MHSSWLSKSPRRATAVTLFSVFLVSGLGAVEPKGSTPPLQVVATFSILGDWVGQVGGDRIQLTVLVGPDADAHVYEPTPGDSRAIRQAACLIRNGLHFEGWLDRLVVASGYHGLTITATEGITPHILTTAGEEKIPDPHAWQDVGLAKIYVANIARGLSQASPRDSFYFQANAKRAESRLDSLDKWVRLQFASLPAKRRRVVISHDAFSYFGRAYGIEFFAPLGFGTDEDASAGRLANLISRLRKLEVTAIFVENIVDPRLVGRVAHEIGAQIGGKLYSDALSRPEGLAPDYFSLMRYNVLSLVSAMRDSTSLVKEARDK
jgi:zinc/manganese transport system substrate-binding protein